MHRRKIIRIIDINGKKRKVLSVKKISQQIPDVISNNILKKEYVEVIILGKTGRTWSEWYPFEEFKKMNQNVRIR